MSEELLLCFGWKVKEKKLSLQTGSNVANFNIHLFSFTPLFFSHLTVLEYTFLLFLSFGFEESVYILKYFNQ